MTQTLEPIDTILKRLETQMKVMQVDDMCKLQMFLSPEAAELLDSRDMNIIAQVTRAVGSFNPVYYDVLKGSHERVRAIAAFIDSQAMCRVVPALYDFGTIVIVSLKRECPPFESQRAPTVTAFLVKGTVRVSVYTD